MRLFWLSLGAEVVEQKGSSVLEDQNLNPESLSLEQTHQRE